MEFLAYRLLYYVYSNSSADARVVLMQLTPSERTDPALAHALAVRAAAATNNYHRLFELYRIAPAMGRFAMDLFAHKFRVGAIQVMAEA